MKKQKSVIAVYLVLRLLVLAILIIQIYNKNWDDVFMCVLTLTLFMIPSIMQRRINIELPETMEIVILLFIFAAEILGEIREYYLAFKYWDTILHTINGFLCGAIGFSMIDLLNRDDRVAMKLSPIFTVMVAFCFSMTIGVLWEFFEYGMDKFFLYDMQKDTVITSITSVMFHPDGRNIPVTIPIESVVVNGVKWDYGGYIDIGLIDTMSDLFVNFIGATVFSVIGYFYTKHGKARKLMERFLIKKKVLDGESSDMAEESAEETQW